MSLPLCPSTSITQLIRVGASARIVQPKHKNEERYQGGNHFLLPAGSPRISDPSGPGKGVGGGVNPSQGVYWKIRFRLTLNPCRPKKLVGFF